MIPELGHFAIILALMVAIVQGVLPLLGAHRNDAAWIALARPAAQVHWLLLAFAFVCLSYAFLTNDFSVQYVAAHSNSKLPEIYRLAAVWGGHEGSLLLWVLLLASWTLAVSLLSEALPESMVARVIGVLGLVSCGMLLFILLTSNPFDRLVDIPADGRDLNPLLQDPGLIIHPPMLYMGYVGFSVAFAFAIAALLSGQLDAAWARWSRPWTVAAWIFLTLGVGLGSWWAYYELGWGGWWFWDPVENASFMPWLVGTALIHSLAVTEKRGAFKNWTVLLAIGAFSLSLLGTFLVRSGVLTSVHAFATDPRRGIFILTFLVIVIGSSLLLFAWRAPKVGLGGRFALMSRETLLLVNNVLLVVACGSVLLGTLYPLFIDALGLGKLSVGPPYFEAVFVPLMVPLLFLIAAGPVARWKQADAGDMTRRLRIAFAVSVAAGLGLPFAFGSWTPLVGLGVLLAVWIVAGSVVQIRERFRSDGAGTGASRSFWGMHVAHIGVAVFVIGVTMVKGYESEKDVRMAPGDTVEVGGYMVRLLGVRDTVGPNYRASVGDVELSRDGKLLRHMHPEKRAYFSSSMPMTEAAIDTGFTRDVYVSLGEPVGIQDGSGAWSVRVHLKPFVDWIWGGCLLMALGGMIAISDRRYRLKSRAAKPAPGVAGRRARMKRFLIPMALFVVLVGFLAVGLKLDPREVPSPLVGKLAPQFELPQLANPDQKFTPLDMKGKVWLLNVWASWCVSCRQEHPLLVALSKSGAVPIYGLNYKDARADGLRWLSQFGDPYIMSLFDADGRVGIDYGVYGVPETYLIDKAGVIRYKHIGPVTRDALDQKILPLVKELERS